MHFLFLFIYVFIYVFKFPKVALKNVDLCSRVGVLLEIFPYTLFAFATVDGCPSTLVLPLKLSPHPLQSAASGLDPKAEAPGTTSLKPLMHPFKVQ